jgi:hypothetical protein
VAKWSRKRPAKSFDILFCLLKFYLFQHNFDSHVSFPAVSRDMKEITFLGCYCQKDNTEACTSHHEAEIITRYWQCAMGYTLNALFAPASLHVNPDIDMHATM